MTSVQAALRAFAALVLASGFALAPSCGGGGGDVVRLLVALFTPEEPAPGPGTVSLQAGEVSNDVFEVRIMVTEVSDFFGASFRVAFPAGSVRFLSWDTSGSFLLDAPATASDVFFKVDATSSPGQVIVVATRLQNPSGTMPGVDVTGPPRELLSLTFQATREIPSPGQPLSFADPREVRDSAQPPPGNLIQVDWPGGTVTASR